MTQDTEEKRYADRLQAIGMKRVRDYMLDVCGVSVRECWLDRKWVADQLGRSQGWVSLNWNKPPNKAHEKPRSGRPRKLDDQDVRLIVDNSSKKRKRGHRMVASLLGRKRQKTVHHTTVKNYRERAGLKKYVRKARPLKTRLNTDNRMTFCKHVIGDWDKEDALHLVPSDEFFFYSVRKPNGQNDIIWARSKADLDGMDLVSVPRSPTCVGVFIMFSAKRLSWVMKEKGQSWNGDYFRSILKKTVIPFLKDPLCVLDPDSSVFLHDKAPCMKAIATQSLLKAEGIEFFDNSEWAGNSPDLNPAENIGSIVMDHVEDALCRRRSQTPASLKDLKRIVRKCCKELQNDRELFRNLLESFVDRRDAVLRNKGGHTDY